LQSRYYYHVYGENVHRWQDDYYAFTPVELPEGPANWGFCSKDCYLNTTTEKPAGQSIELTNYTLKGRCHDIFDPQFFRQSITPRPQIDTLQYFRILFRILRDIRL
jgi:hypothetical protein